MKSVSLEARWEAIALTVPLDPNGGSCNIPSLNMTYGINVTLPTPSRTGYEFTGWYQMQGTDNVEVISGVCRLTTDTPLVANWKPIQYTIAYNLDGGNNHALNFGEYNCTQTVTLHAPEKHGYDFLGWTYEGQSEPVLEVIIPEGTMENKEYTAKWRAKTTTVTLDAKGGSVSDTTLRLEYAQDYTLATPTRTGYTFRGWKTADGAEISDGTWTGIEKDVPETLTLIADWQANTYSVTLRDVHLYSNSRTVTLVNYEQDGSDKVMEVEGRWSYNALVPPARDGYLFAGWYTDSTLSTVYDFTSALTGNVTLHAKWVEVNTAFDGVLSLNGQVKNIQLTNEVEKLYAFVAPVRGSVTIYTEHESGDPFIQLYNANMDPLGSKHDDDHGDNGDAEASQLLQAGQVYYVGVGSYGDGTVSLHLETEYDIDGGSIIADGKSGYWYESGQQEEVEIAYDDAFAYTPFRDGFEFTGWRVVGTDTVIRPGDLWKIATDAILEAVWS